jgi:tripartite ATP-independent transporter DctP family solute receptor
MRVIVAAICAFLLWTTGSDARQFRAADNQAETYPTVQALNYFGRLIRQRTNGRHSILVFHSRQLGEERDTIEQTIAGAIDINRTNVAPLGDLVPELNALSLPFLFNSPAHLYKVLDGPIGEEILSRFDESGLIGLAFFDSGARSIYNTQRPVRHLGDMRGLRFRVQQSEPMVELIRALGAVPVVMAYGQVGTALATRLIDGAENNWPSYVTTGHVRAARYLTLTEHTMAPEVLTMSRRAWDTLTPAEQRIFREAAREASLFMRDLWRTWEEQARTDARSAGVIVEHDFDRAAFESAARVVYDRIVKDERQRALVERIREAGRP